MLRLPESMQRFLITVKHQGLLLMQVLLSGLQRNQMQLVWS